MVLWVGVDDTDSLKGMCTTYLATEIVHTLAERYDLIGYPRLVRLNPNIPWKTRGNGAVCFRVGHGFGGRIQIGFMAGRPVYAYARGRSVEDPNAALRRVTRVLERHAVFDDPTTNPGAVVLCKRPPPSLYWRAVREIVPLDHVSSMLPLLGAFRGYKNRRGLIGASAAVAWRPRDRTFELLSYRARDSWGTRRILDSESVQTMDAAFPSTFSNLDPATGRVAIAPHSPCPVLYGIRGEDPGCLQAAQAVLSSEPPDRWFLFETNQGTDDHILWDDWTLRPGTATSIAGTVGAPAKTTRGGHTFVPLVGRTPIDLAFYEPSKDFRQLARALVPGDRLRAWGSVRADGLSLNVEKVYVKDFVSRRVRVANPRCLSCGKSMKSAGRDNGYRCVRGHGRAPPGAGEFAEVMRPFPPGWYEPPAYARRHLTMPVKRVLHHPVSAWLQRLTVAEFLGESSAS